MGKMADDMLRLSEEIKAMRADRAAFAQTLKGSVAQMKEKFRREHAEMARTSRAERREFMADLARARKAWSGLASAGAGSAKGVAESLKKETEGRKTERQKHKESGQA